MRFAALSTCIWAWTLHPLNSSPAAFKHSHIPEWGGGVVTAQPRFLKRPMAGHPEALCMPPSCQCFLLGPELLQTQVLSFPRNYDALRKENVYENNKLVSTVRPQCCLLPHSP